MPHLILLRHAKAEPTAASGRDFDRPLAARGHRDSAIIGQALAAAGFTPDRVLVSAAQRALETWQAAKPAFPTAQARIVSELYLAPSEQLASLAEEESDAASLMIIAHNPGLHEYALALHGDDADPRLAGFPTAAAAVFEMDGAGGGRLIQVLHVRDHGGGAV